MPTTTRIVVTAMGGFKLAVLICFCCLQQSMSKSSTTVMTPSHEQKKLKARMQKTLGFGHSGHRSNENTKDQVTENSKHTLSTFDLGHFDVERQREWEKRVSQYDTIFTGEYETWYTANKVTLHPKRSGVRGASAIIDDTHRLLMCTIPKIGSSTWRKFMLYLSFPSIEEAHGKKYYFEVYGVKRPDFHNISKNGLKLMAVQHPTTALEIYNDPSMLKVFHSRNPVTRLLSAWLSKNAQSKDPKPFAMVFPTFGEFVQVYCYTDVPSCQCSVEFPRIYMLVCVWGHSSADALCCSVCL